MLTADRFCVLTTLGPLATKTLGRDPETRKIVVAKAYDAAALFRVGAVPVRSPAELHAALTDLSQRPRAFVIRGESLPGTDLARCRRLLHPYREDDGSITPATFRAVPRRWLALDFDGVPPPAGPYWINDPCATVSYLALLLPSEFDGCTCVIQATASAGIKPGIRARLWYMLDRPVSDAGATRWLAAAPIDRSLFRAVQPHYTAAPVLHDVPDPMPWRLHLMPGARERVTVPKLPEPQRNRLPPPVPGNQREGMRYALAALADECSTVAGAGIGDRHAALNRAAFKLARFLRGGELAGEEMVLSLLAAARRAGLDDSDAELRRFLRSGLRAGLDRAGV